MHPDVHRAIIAYPEMAQSRLRDLRALIYEVAASIEGVGPIEESLRWGEPAYLTSQSNAGTTLRIAWKPKIPESYSIFVHCQTNLIETYRSLFPDLACHGNREVRLALSQALPDCVRDCIALALTYKRPDLLSCNAGHVTRPETGRPSSTRH